MRLARTLFREYDVRGRVPEIFPDAKDELSDAGMRHLGQSFGTLAKERGRTSVVLPSHPDPDPPGPRSGPAPVGRPSR